MSRKAETVTFDLTTIMDVLSEADGIARKLYVGSDCRDDYSVTSISFARLVSNALVEKSHPQPPIPMRLHCPECMALHVDVGEFETKAHHTHACQHCGHVWRPAIVATIGVQFLPGFKDSV